MYQMTLSEHGFDSMATLKAATLSDLERIGLKLGHARLLVTKAAYIAQPENLEISTPSALCRYREFLRLSLPPDVHVISKSVRRSVRAKKAELGIDHDWHWSSIQAIGWSQTDYEDGERAH
jgi:hypothetical protein